MQHTLPTSPISQTLLCLFAACEFVFVMQQEVERRAAYNADITYITNSELGFDYLRDNLAQVHSIIS